MDANFFEHIRQTLSAHPEQVFVVWPAGRGEGPESASYTGRDILGRVGAIHRFLVDKQVAAGQSVMLALPVSLDLVCSLLALMALGAVPVLPPAGVSAAGLLRLMRREQIRTVLVPLALGQSARLGGWAFGVRAVALAAVGGPVVPAAAVAVAAGQAALVSHSSGSTGRPKAIRRSHRVLAAQHQAIKAVFPPWAGQRDFPLFPNILLHNLSAGVVSILPNALCADARELSPARLLAQVQRERVQTMTGNVHYFAALLRQLRQEPVALPAVVGIGIGGSPVPEPLVQALQQYFPQAAVHVIYGSSEAEPIAVRQAGTLPTNPLAGYCVGALHPALECRIRFTGQLRRGGDRGTAVGEVLVRGPHVATAVPGYWLSTGDYGYLLDGQLFLTGRQGNERVHQGVQHYQIEHLLYHLPGVERVAARADDDGFTLFVQGRVSRAVIEELLAKNFPANLCSAILLRSQLPVDARHQSKILYDQLR